METPSCAGFRFRDGEFATVPLNSEDWRAALRAELSSAGLVITHGVSTRDLGKLLERDAQIFVHPDAGSDGVTLITPTGESRGGFSRMGLAPHTDRSTVAEPPSVLVLVMAQPSRVGGDAQFADSKVVVLAMLEQGLSMEEILSIEIRPYEDGERSFPFVEEVVPGGLVTRYREDHVARPVARDPLIIEVLRQAIEDHLITVRLESGDGYVLNNRRWLHGRTGFSGDRSASRLLFASPATAMAFDLFGPN